MRGKTLKLMLVISLMSVMATAVEAGVVAGYSLGTVTELSQTCTANPQPGVECRTLEVACPELPAIQVTLQIRAPNPGSSTRGTIVFSGGGGGTGYYNEPELFEPLQAQGFRIIDRAWAETWYNGGQGIRKGACRYASLATWIREIIHIDGAFCATGNSGGAAEVGHAMTTYGRGAIFDHVMPTSGPAVARLDYACLGQNNTQWLQQCDALIPNAKWQCTPACTVSGDQGGVCSAGATADEHALLYDSVLAPNAVLKYSRTRMDFIEGTLDCQVSPVMGTLFYNTVSSLKSLQYIQDAPHVISSVTQGRTAMIDTLVQQCIVRH